MGREPSWNIQNEKCVILYYYYKFNTWKDNLSLPAPQESKKNAP
ncbi:hypothetical protein B932_3425 [Gluconobacter oxydans H24]|nr:hypothetical protein B932_3425 [Gluconobacter oxydans H24]